MPLTGENIDAYCLKCKLLLAHVIMFKVGETVSRVKCKTCGAEHKYRPDRPAANNIAVRKAPEVKESAKRVAAKNKLYNAPMEWDLKKRNLGSSTPIRDYSVHDRYNAGEVINHSVFGLGFVKRIVTDKTMDVLFSDSVKLMAMNVT